jgi:hypothetical protein
MVNVVLQTLSCVYLHSECLQRPAHHRPRVSTLFLWAWRWRDERETSHYGIIWPVRHRAEDILKSPLKAWKAGKNRSYQIDAPYPETRNQVARMCNWA